MIQVRSQGRCPSVELITSFVDGELTAQDGNRVQDHVAGCGTCQVEVAAQRRVKAALAGASGFVMDPALRARLRAIPAREPHETAPVEVDELAARRGRSRRLPTYATAAASVAVFMVGGFAFLGASDQNPQRPSTVAIVPAADQFTMEHAATTTQAGFGGPGFSAVSVSSPSFSNPVDGSSAGAE